MTTLLQLAPNSTVRMGDGGARGAPSIQGGASADAILRDASDTSTVYSTVTMITNNAGVICTLGVPTVPVGTGSGQMPALARVESIRVYLRVRFGTGHDETEVAVFTGPVSSSAPNADYASGAYDNCVHQFFTSLDNTFFDFYTYTKAFAANGVAWDALVRNGPLGFSLLLTCPNQAVGRPDPALIDVAEARIEVFYQQAPSVFPATPTGSTGTPFPTVTWTYGDVDGYPQQSYQVRIFTKAQTTTGGFSPDTVTPVADSGEIYSNATSWPCPVVLNNGTTYVAYVRVSKPWGGQGGTFYSFWGNGPDFTIAVTVPNAPTLNSLVADPEQGRVYVEAQASGSGLAATNARFESSADGGTTWQLVRNGGQVAYSSGVAAIYDYEVPSRTMQYRVASVAFSSGIWVSGPYSVPQQVGCYWQDVFLRDPVYAANGLNFVVRVAPPFTPESHEAVGVFEPLSRSKAVVMSDGFKAWRGRLKLWVIGDDDVLAIGTMTRFGVPLRLDLPTGESWIMRLLEKHAWDKLRTVSTDPDRPVGTAYGATFDWIEVDRPTTNLSVLTPS